MSDSINHLTTLFTRFPGIGPRQAQRFVQFLLRNPATRRELVETVQSLAGSVHQCTQCMRYSAQGRSALSRHVCSICENPERDAKYLAIVASDVDFSALERSHIFRGFYFVLGGTISLASEKTSGLHIKQLLDSIPARIKSGLKEIILAFPANPEGDITSVHIREKLAGIAEEHALSITALGRGLSTGSELEYADPDTIKSAIENRR